MRGIYESPTLCDMLRHGDLQIEYVQTRFPRQKYYPRMDVYEHSYYGFLLFVTNLNWDSEPCSTFSYESKRNTDSIVDNSFLSNTKKTKQNKPLSN